MSAKEMFKKLGYQEVYRGFDVIYRRLWDFYLDDEELKQIVEEEKELRFLVIAFNNLICPHVAIGLEDCKASLKNGEIITETKGKQIEGPKIGFIFQQAEVEAINKKLDELK